MIMIGARYVAGAASTCATTVDGFVHRRQNLWILAHAQIIIGTPNGYFLNAVLIMAGRAREMAGVAL